MFFEDRLIYFPSRHPEGPWRSQAALGARDVAFRADDGVDLHGWWTPAPNAVGTVLLFHGNAGNLADRAFIVRELVRVKLSCLIVDYRGYGKSADVAPSEEGLYRDGRAAWTRLTGELGVPPGQVAIMGESLGGAVATQLATEVDCAALVLVCAFESIPAMARQLVPVPLGWALRHRMANVEKIGWVRAPVFVVHAEHDEVVPFAHGQALFARAHEPKRFKAVPTGGHNEVWGEGGDALFAEIAAFVAESVRR